MSGRKKNIIWKELTESLYKLYNNNFYYNIHEISNNKHRTNYYN